MNLQKSILLAKYSNYNIGGPAKFFLDFKSREELIQGLEDYKQFDNELNSIFILGGGTNILFKDEGFNGLVLKDSIHYMHLEDDFITVSSGVSMSELVDFMIENALSGFEWAGGLPGSVGGAIRGNAGAFGGEIKDSLIEVESIDINNFEIKTNDNKECDFGYRNSIFKSSKRKKEVILNAKFKVEKGDRMEIEEVTNERREFRKRRHPLEYPNLGSTFKNVPVERIPKDILEMFRDSIKQDPFPVVPTAKLIVGANLVGKNVGDAQISEKHPNFIINRGGAKANDVVALIKYIKGEVNDKFKIQLEEEIAIL